MFDKILNFIYDIKDLVISVAIISLLFFAVTWKINDTLNVDLMDPAHAGIVELVPEAPTTTEPITDPTTQPETTEAPTSSAAEATTEAPAASSGADTGKSVEFIVGEGEYGHTIAKNLQAAGLIPDSKAFVLRAAELGLDTKLMQGKFYLRTTDSVDTILKILTGGTRD